MEELYEEFLEKLDTYNLLFSGEVSNLDIHNVVINDLKRLYPEYRIFFMYHIDYVLDDVANVDITTEEVKLYQSKIRKVIINSIKEKYIKKCSQSIEDIEASIETDIYSYEIAKRIKEINDETLDCICRIEKGFIGSGKAA